MLYIDQLIGSSIVVGAAPSPTARATTIITTTEDGAQEFNITGTLDQQWMSANGYYNENEYSWTKTVTQADIGNTVTIIG